MPGERRAEILSAAARIALAEGIERVTLRRVADDLGVRPGLISHYFPVAEHLVSEAFAYAATRERESLLPACEAALPPLDRLARFLVRLADGTCSDLSKLWLNARHISRFNPALRDAVAAQEELTRDSLTRLIAKGARAAELTTDDPFGAALRILVTVDGLGAYANEKAPLDHPVLRDLLTTTAEGALGLPRGLLRERAGA